MGVPVSAVTIVSISEGSVVVVTQIDEGDFVQASLDNFTVAIQEILDEDDPYNINGDMDINSVAPSTAIFQSTGNNDAGLLVLIITLLVPMLISTIYVLGTSVFGMEVQPPVILVRNVATYGRIPRRIDF